MDNTMACKTYHTDTGSSRTLRDHLATSVLSSAPATPIIAPPPPPHPLTSQRYVRSKKDSFVVGIRHLERLAELVVVEVARTVEEGSVYQTIDL